MKPVRVLLPLLTASLVLLGGCAGKGIVMGSVVEGKNSRPVTNGQVVLTPVDGDEAQSGALQYGGRYKMKVKPGDYVISVAHDSLQLCESSPATLSVEANKISNADICMKQG
jgi:hypothetical protein